MNRIWIGGILLAVFLFLGIRIGMKLDTATGPVSALLEQAQTAVLGGAQFRGQALAEQARALWQRCRNGLAAVCPHEPMEEAESLFAQLQAYAGAELWGEFAACCARLVQQLQALTETQSVAWWNLL